MLRLRRSHTAEKSCTANGCHHSPLHGVLLCDAVLHTHTVVCATAAGHTVAWALQHDVEVHAWGVIQRRQGVQGMEAAEVRRRSAPCSKPTPKLLQAPRLIAARACTPSPSTCKHCPTTLQTAQLTGWPRCKRPLYRLRRAATGDVIDNPSPNKATALAGTPLAHASILHPPNMKEYTTCRAAYTQGTMPHQELSQHRHRGSMQQHTTW
jgi:hypothetical protein